MRFHTSRPDLTGRVLAVFHGRGVARDDTRDNTLRYFREIDKEVRGVLRQEKAPLVIAGEADLISLYRGGNSYPHLIDGIVGNPDELKMEQLHERAWSVVEPRFRQAEKEALRRYGDGLSKGLSSSDIRKVVEAAQAGRVDSLFLAAGVSLWGTLDGSKGIAEVHQEHRQGDVDLLDRAALNTFCGEGALYVLDRQTMPDGAALAATFRY